MELNSDDAPIVRRMLATISARRRRNELRGAYVEGEAWLRRVGFSIPPGMADLQLAVGWPAKAVDVRSSRIMPDGFTFREDSELSDAVDEIFDSNQAEVVERMAIDAAVEYGVSFVFTSEGDTSVGEPAELMTVRTALSATAIVDPRSRQTRFALEILEGGDGLFYKPGEVIRFRISDLSVYWSRPMRSNRVLCTPYPFDATVRKPFGRSAVTRPLMGYTDAAVRTLLRQEVSAEFYSAPRLAALGAGEELFVDQNGRMRPAWRAIMGAVWAIPDDEDEVTGEKSRVDLQNIPQMSMQPHSDQLRTIAQMVSGETSIPPMYLGVQSDSNPTSAASVQAQEIDLVRATRRQFPFLGAARESLARDVLTVRFGDLGDAGAASLRGFKARWVDPQYRSVTEQSQMVQLQVQAGNFQPGTESTLRLLPIDPEDAKRIAIDNRRATGSSLIDSLLSGEGPVEEPAVAGEE